ncbi:hypothetical protein [Phytohabitans houttuyneae]|uniref:Uncharacterized protein n=1 Tax=Phytohabitans houttuyneae TaxID=1076126 RepID=A0A6V8K9G4_9ACTN|nr:hypothetical protein [Phytohabitans houttuyneae]GFJ77375.1 hypothetical protein Phou_015550 [Phytohabitans houttuyneae]
MAALLEHTELYVDVDYRLFAMIDDSNDRRDVPLTPRGLGRWVNATPGPSLSLVEGWYQPPQLLPRDPRLGGLGGQLPSAAGDVLPEFLGSRSAGLLQRA